MTRSAVLAAILTVVASSTMLARGYKLTSPDGKTTVSVDDGVTLTVSREGRRLTTVRAALGSMSGKVLGMHTTRVKRETINALLYRQQQFTTAYRQAEIMLSGQLGMEVRAYDDGVSYRFRTSNDGETVVSSETAVFGFPEESKAWLAYSTNAEKPFAMAFQNTYHETLLRDARALPAFLPATVDVGGGVKVTILESDLRHYPGMFLKAGSQDAESHDEGTDDCLTAVFAPYPKRMNYYRWRGMSYVAETEDYIAKSTGRRTYPWRVMAITTDDTQMPTSHLVYALATPNQTGDTSWIRPGKVAWDWWHDWNLKGVSFKAGINTDTYLYYIDFAAKYGLEYIVMDEGWYDSSKGDLMNPIAAVDLQRIIDYGRQRGVGVVLWTVFNVLDEHLAEACSKYAQMGIKGFKVDFMDRNDQTAVDMAERIARTCAEHRLLLDYHGFWAPTGLSRTYPNVVNYEGVFGMEEARWAKKTTDMPLYDVTFPFIRMMAGQVDFTPGAMRNGTRENWVECYQNPVSMGTRCHQAACYVVHDSPFTMLADTPHSYEQDSLYTRFIAEIPDTWDETRVVQGEIGRYIVTARRKGDTWYMAGQTNWDERTIELPLSVVGDGSYTVTLLADGINAGHNAEDYKIDRLTRGNGDTLTIRMASGGGFVLKIRKVNIVEHY